MNKYKISFATVCMNRLHHLKETLPRNIDDNINYPEVEFVLLDYNSSDGLEEWVQTNLEKEIQNQKVKYFRTTEPLFFNRSHSRNLAFNLCSGEIFCNVDADNYTGLDFAEYVNEQFNNANNIIINSNFLEEYYPYKDAYGRFAAWKDDFHFIGGYDESMTSYGYEDMDLYERLVMKGRKELKITNFDFLRCISHGNEERLSQEYFSNNLLRFYVAYENRSTKVIFLFKDGTFETGTMTDKDEFYRGLYAINEGDWLQGKWLEQENFLMLEFCGGKIQKMKTENNGIFYKFINQDLRLTFFRVDDQHFLNKVKASYSLVSNISRLRKNLTAKRITVNTEKGYGRGLVYANFGSVPLLIEEPKILR